MDLPSEPPSYDVVNGQQSVRGEVGHASASASASASADIETGRTRDDSFDMDIDESALYENEGDGMIGNLGSTSIPYFSRIKNRLNDNIIEPVQNNIIDPLVGLNYIVTDTVNYYVSKVGNPFILSRFIYIFIISIVAYGLLSREDPNKDHVSGTRGSFADHDAFLNYARLTADLSKFERDLEYLSSMPHMSGTKGDTAMRQYIYQSMKNNNIHLLREWEAEGFANYPKDDGMSLRIRPQSGEPFSIELTDVNFNPGSPNGELRDINLIYGHYGSEQDLQLLKEAQLLKEDFVLLIKYDQYVSQQVLMAQNYGAKAIVFISDVINGNENVIKQNSVSISQYGAGIMEIRYPNLKYSENSETYSKTMPSIPTLPLSYKQGRQLMELLHSGIKYENKYFSGKPGIVKVDMRVDNVLRTAQPISDFVGKIEGKEQSDRAIVIAARRNSIDNGATTSAFGTAMMLSLIQLFQEMKFRFNWKPLRNIYFISFGGSDFNFEGSNTLVEQRLSALKEEIYAMVDISEVGLDFEDLGHLDIQCHPLMYDFFKSKSDHSQVDVNVLPVHDFGDWTPYLTHGIPTATFSKSKLKSKLLAHTKADTFERVGHLLKQSNYQEKLLDVLIFLFRSALLLVDKPVIPFEVSTFVTELDSMLNDLEISHKGQIRFDTIIKGLLMWKRLGKECTAWKHEWSNIVENLDNGMEPSLFSVHRWAWNKKITNIGRRLCAPNGLTDRNNYKNVIFGPTLFANNKDLLNWSFPGVRDAIYKQDYNKAQEELDGIGEILMNAAKIFSEETTDSSYK